ncbi:hypothetical protein CSUI_009981 [Cystoisospora suis]|uniref:Uncharacterized protein n=1 Tax=Cystoisospora suis TaxID=483139 RepID=A0A2C6KF84_9APIC|nr:hypothetical protein CSUI_009981 [Cystoisospora suis]
MVYGVIVFSAEGSSPLFSTFFTPEGNDEHMQKRQQGVIRKVVEDRLFQVQCSRDVLLASRSPDINSPIDDPLSSTTGLGGGGASQSLRSSSSSASLAFSSPSSFSSFNDIPRRKQRPNRDRKRINQERKAGEGRSASSAPGVDPHTPEFKSHANGISSSMEIAQGMAGGGVYTPGDDW